MKPTGQQLQDIVGQVTELTWNHAIWWELVDKKNRSKYEPVFGEYQILFCSIIASFQQCMFVTVRRLFDDRDDVLSIERLVRNLDSSDPAAAKDISVKIKEHSGLLDKCKHLRHKVHAHRDLNLSAKDAYEDAEIKPQDLRKLVDFVQEVTAALCGIEGKNSREKMIETFQDEQNYAGEQIRDVIEKVLSVNSGA